MIFQHFNILFFFKISFIMDIHFEGIGAKDLYGSPKSLKENNEKF